MASTNNDGKLIFPIGFDLSEGVKQAAKDWNSKYQKELTNSINKKPIKIKLQIDARGWDKDLKNLVELAKQARQATDMLNKQKRQEADIRKRNANAKREEARASREGLKLKYDEATLNARIMNTIHGAKIQQQKWTEVKRNGYAATVGMNKALATQSTYLGRLVQRMAAYFSIHQAFSFLRKIKDTTAEFELQRVALGALIQDAYKANTIFEQIKVQSVKSPYQITDLVDFTKRLAAYGVEADDLMDTMNRLADISAGLGTDMDRIILAYGQIQAAGVLKGTELRQLTELGLPMVDMLANYYSTLRNEVVSTSEIFDMISKKEIPFEAVKDVLEDLTDEGGRFFDMQTIQAKTLAGQWANMKDTMSIMFDEIGSTKEFRSFLTGLIETVKSLARNWQEVWRILKTTGLVFLGYKAFGKIIRMLSLETIRLGVAETQMNVAASKYYSLSWKIHGTSKLRALQTKLHTQAIYKQATATNFLTRSMYKLLAAMSANPGSWLLGGGLVLAFLGIRNAINGGKDAMDAFRERQREMVQDAVKNTETMTASFEQLADEVIRSEDGSEKQNKALRKLKDQFGDMFPEYKLTVDYLRSMTDEAGNFTSAINSMTSTIRNFSGEKMRQSLIENYMNQLEEQFGDVYSRVTDTKRKNYARNLGNITRWALEEEMSDLEFTRKVFNDYLETLGMDDVEFVKKLVEAIYEGSYSDIEDKFLSQLRSGDVSFLLTKAVPKSAKEAFPDLWDWGYIWELAQAFRDADKEINRMMESFDQLDPKLSQVNALISSMNAELEQVSTNTGGANLEEVTKNIGTLRNLTIHQAWDDLLEMFEINADSIKDFDLSIENVAHNFDEFLRIAHEANIEIPDAFFAGYEQISSALGLYDDMWREDLANMKAYLDNGTRLVQTYGADQIKALTDLPSALEDVAKRYKELNDALPQRKKTYAAAVASGEDVKLIEDYRKEISKYETDMKFLYAFLEKYGALGLLEKEKTTKAKQVMDELAMVEKIYKKYQDYLKIMTGAEAKKATEAYFKDVDLKILSKAFSDEDLKSVLNRALELIKSYNEDTAKEEQEIQFKIGDVDYDDAKETIERELDVLAKDIARSKSAKEFFEKILGITGDKELSASMTVSVYGVEDASNLSQYIASQMQEQVQKYFGNIKITDAINEATGEIDAIKLETLLETSLSQDPNAISEDNVKSIRKLIEDLIKEDDKYWNQMMKDLEKAKTYGDKLVKVYETTQERIDKINSREDISKDTKNALVEQAKRVQTKEMQKLQYEAFKDGPMYVAMFENLDTTSTSMLANMRNYIEDLKSEWKDLEPTQLKELQSRINDIDKTLSKRNPIKTLITSFKEYNALSEQRSREDDEKKLLEASIARAKAQENFDKAVAEGKTTEEIESLAEALDKCVETEEEATKEVEKWDDATKKMVQSAKDLKVYVNLIQKATTATKDIVESFGGWGDEADEEFWNTMIDSIGKFAEGLSSVAEGITRIYAGDIVGGISSLIEGIGDVASAIGDWIYVDRIKQSNKEIERQQDIIDNYTKQLEHLNDVAEKAFGVEYLLNYRKQLAILNAEAEAYRKQAEAEMDKGKKEDEEKTKEYLEAEQEALKERAELYGALSEKFLGSDLTSAARDFAQAWIDAYKEFGNTTNAISDKFEEMLENMVVEAVLASVMERALKPVYTMIEEMDDKDFYDRNFWSTLVSTMDEATTNGVTGAQTLMALLESMGINIRELGGDMTGISRDIATASEESILGLAAGINTQNFYISQVPNKLDTIIALMQGKQVVGNSVNMQDLITIQNQHLSYLPNIAQNTAETVAQCKRVADSLERVVKPTGVKASYTLNTSM